MFNFKRNGRGKLVTDIEIYEGYWLNGEKHGHGKMYSLGGCYEGEFKEGKITGKGVTLSSDGSRYEGNKVKGLRDG